MEDVEYEAEYIVNNELEQDAKKEPEEDVEKEEVYEAAEEAKEVVEEEPWLEAGGNHKILVRKCSGAKPSLFDEKVRSRLLKGLQRSWTQWTRHCRKNLKPSRASSCR